MLEMYPTEAAKFAPIGSKNDRLTGLFNAPQTPGPVPAQVKRNADIDGSETLGTVIRGSVWAIGKTDRSKRNSTKENSLTPKKVHRKHSPRKEFETFGVLKYASRRSVGPN
jgi:hypothetical protein